MRIAVVHGYFLGDSGSGVYTRNLARELREDGHDVILFCQEREPANYSFIDSLWTLDATNTALQLVGEERPRHGEGSCRLVRPDLGGRLLVYVDGPFAGFETSEVKTFQDAPDEWIDSYIEANVAALRTAFSKWEPDIVLAQHAVMQPHVVRRALRGACPYTVTTHGSELNFSLKLDPRLAGFGVSGLSGAQAVVAVSPASAEDVIGWAASHDLDIAEKTTVIAPGVDTATFVPAPDRATAIEKLAAHVDLPDDFELSPGDEVLAFVGRVGWNKGIQHAVVALSLVSAVRPRVKLLVAGEGPARAALMRLASLFSAGDATGARKLATGEHELRTTAEYGPLVPEDVEALGQARVAFLGHLTTPKVARVFAAADIALAPSVFPEAAALVTSEGLSSGALPIVTYQTGLRMLADIESTALGDPLFRALQPGRGLSTGLAEAITRNLDRYPTADNEFRRRLHRIAVEHFPSWLAVARRNVELATQAREARAGGSRPT